MNIVSILRASALSALIAAGFATPAKAITLTLDPGATWFGYMNRFELPSNGGGFAGGGPWGTGDLRANFAGSTLTVTPAFVADGNPFWYTGGEVSGTGNKIMEANFYQESNGGLAGQTVDFTGYVLSNTFSAHTVTAFIRDFAPDFSSFNESVVTLSSPGAFNVTLTAINDPARHVQAGIQVRGVNISSDALAAGTFGSMQLSAIPEPSTYAAIAGVLALALAARRARKS